MADAASSSSGGTPDFESGSVGSNPAGASAHGEWGYILALRALNLVRRLQHSVSALEQQMDCLMEPIAAAEIVASVGWSPLHEGIAQLLMSDSSPPCELAYKIVDMCIAQGMLPDRAINEDLSVPQDQQARSRSDAPNPQFPNPK